MKVFYSLALCFHVTSLIAQEIPPVLTEKPNRGIYRDFNEFLANTPTIKTEFRVASPSGPAKMEKGTADYKLQLLDSATRRRDLRKFWGFSDGENIFINEAVYTGAINFKKLHGVGRYCYFKGSAPRNYVGLVNGGAIGGLLMATVVEADGDYPYVLNINNGGIFLLDKSTLRTILKKDPELASSFEDAEKKSKRDTRLAYIVEYNKRHPEEVRYKKPKPVEVVFLRRRKNEQASPIVLSVDSLQFSLPPNSLERTTWVGDSLEICIQENCRSIPLEPKEVNYVECTWKSDSPDFKKINRESGEYYEREIRVTNERKSRAK